MLEKSNHGGAKMGLSKEEKLELTRKEARALYGCSDTTLDNYLREYKQSVGIPIVPKKKIVNKSKDNAFEIAKTIDLDAYMAMSKEELIDELIKAKANELRAKKGYEVKGDGANKEFISLNNRNLK